MISRSALSLWYFLIYLLHGCVTFFPIPGVDIVLHFMAGDNSALCSVQ